MKELSCRLIQASNLAYAIDYTKPLTQQSAEVFAALREIRPNLPDSAICPNRHGRRRFWRNVSAAVLAFRGTQSPTIVMNDQRLFLAVLNDWLDDLKISAHERAKPPRPRAQRVLNSLDALWPKIQTFVGATPKPLYATGHSKGGGLDFLASYRLSKTGSTSQAVYTFAAPKVGDAAFAEAYDAEVPETYRVEYQDDLVPHLPASTGAWAKIRTKP